MSRAAPRLIATLACLAAIARPTLARADQFVAMDATWEHTADLADSHYRVKPSAETPADWTSPVDYSDGTAWVYLEVQTKPTEQETKFQICFEATPTYACTAQSPTYTTTGTLEWPTPFAEFWSPPNEYVDWSQGVNQIANILKDTMNNKPSADNVGEETAALYTPTRVRMVVTIVSAGDTYVPPTPTGTGEGGGGAGPVGGSGGDGGESTASGPTTMPIGGSPSAGGSDSAGGGTSSPATEDGCSLASPVNLRGRGGLFLTFGLGLALFLGRRFGRAKAVRIPASWHPARKTRVRRRRRPRATMS